MPKLGERPVTSLETRHPTLAIILPIIEQTQRATLMSGWWFNEYPYKAMPNVDGEITVGIDTLSFIPDCPDVAVQRGVRLFNPVTMSYVFTEPVPATVIQLVDFDELPESVANYIFYSALVECYTTDIGVTQELSVWTNLASKGWSDMVAEHLRQRKHSTRNTKQWRRMRRAMRA